MALEAMSRGTPVIAYGEGGATETVIHGQTGLFFSQQNVEALVYALEKSRTIEWNPDLIREHSAIFSEERFESGIRHIVDNILLH